MWSACFRPRPITSARGWVATRLVLPGMPVIPLGIHTEDFIFSDAQRSQARQAIGAHDQTLVVLFIGRLSFHAKAHPLAMYQALELAAKGRKAVLVECGWYANDHIRSAFTEAAHSACPGVQFVTLDGRNAQDRATAWASADVFCSLSENIQETFGITPIEAMADGLSVVVSDWDGYKDTVRDGVDGFRIPTLMPSAGLGVDLAAAHALETDTLRHVLWPQLYVQRCGCADHGRGFSAFVRFTRTSPADG